MTGHAMFGTDDLFPFRYNEERGKGESKNIYALVLSTGVVKVGQSCVLQSRIAHHVTLAAAHGVTVKQVWVSVAHLNYDANEAALLTFCRSLASEQIASEYFKSVPYQQVVDFAESSLTYDRMVPAKPYVPVEPKQLFTLDEVAADAGVTARVLERACWTRRLKHIHYGGLRRMTATHRANAIRAFSASPATP